MSQGPTEAGVHQVQSWTSTHTNTNSDSFSVQMGLIWLPSEAEPAEGAEPAAERALGRLNDGNMQMWMQMLDVSQLRLSVQIENIDVCLTFLAAKGVNTQGLSAEGKPPTPG